MVKNTLATAAYQFIRETIESGYKPRMCSEKTKAKRRRQNQIAKASRKKNRL